MTWTLLPITEWLKKENFEKLTLAQKKNVLYMAKRLTEKEPVKKGGKDAPF